ncbi:reticulon-like protein B12 [Olea europaea var. sylvestris]|uniref:reticulon-like protein B12 n=1 Tax=Olea europaea var. sylvestris TaxID=158386 RepID=UPI000C1D414E|nr:reticulon-like protein B12 [Olea europaea var. sylvestris]
MNVFPSVFEDIALGRDSKMFTKVVSSLFLISVIGSVTDFLTLGYTSLFIVLTVPAFYERYEDLIKTHNLKSYQKLQQLYIRFDAVFTSKIQKLILEAKKLS